MTDGTIQSSDQESSIWSLFTANFFPKTAIGTTQFSQNSPLIQAFPTFLFPVNHQTSQCKILNIACFPSFVTSSYCTGCGRGVRDLQFLQQRTGSIEKTRFNLVLALSRPSGSDQVRRKVSSILCAYLDYRSAMKSDDLHMRRGRLLHLAGAYYDWIR